MKEPGKHTTLGNRLLDDLRDTVAHLLLEGQIEPGRAQQIAVELRNRIAEHWGGQLIYVPKDTAQHISERDQELYKEFTGTNQHELAEKYRLSLQWVYTIIRRMRKANQQPGLFD